MKPLQDKVALITGANRGIGRGVAICLAEDGADVVVNYRTHQQEAQEVVEAITRMGRRALAWRADVGDRAQVVEPVVIAVKTERGGGRRQRPVRPVSVEVDVRKLVAGLSCDRRADAGLLGGLDRDALPGHEGSAHPAVPEGGDRRRP